MAEKSFGMIVFFLVVLTLVFGTILSFVGYSYLIVSKSDECLSLAKNISINKPGTNCYDNSNSLTKLSIKFNNAPDKFKIVFLNGTFEKEIVVRDGKAGNEFLIGTGNFGEIANISHAGIYDFIFKGSYSNLEIYPSVEYFACDSALKASLAPCSLNLTAQTLDNLGRNEIFFQPLLGNVIGANGERIRFLSLFIMAIIAVLLALIIFVVRRNKH